MKQIVKVFQTVRMSPQAIESGIQELIRNHEDARIECLHSIGDKLVIVFSPIDDDNSK